MEIRYETLDACPICGSTQKIFLFKNTDRLHGIPGEFGLNRCINCMVYYLSPRPVLNSLPLYYPDDYVPHQISESTLNNSTFRRIRDILRNTVLYERYHCRHINKKDTMPSGILRKTIVYLLFPLWKRARYGYPKHRLPPLIKEGKALDIGCGVGNYMLFLKKFGYEVHGVEPSKNAAKLGREKFGLDIRTGTLLEHTYPNDYFHFISMHQVIEHLHNPVEVLKEIKRILHPEGNLFIWTPNMDSYGFQKFGKHWSELETPRHLILYSKFSLQYLSDIVGLKLKTLRTVSPTYGYPTYFSLLWSLEYETKYKNGIDTHGIQDINTLLSKFNMRFFDLYEKMLILAGKPAGEDIWAVLAK